MLGTDVRDFRLLPDHLGKTDRTTNWKQFVMVGDRLMRDIYHTLRRNQVFRLSRRLSPKTGIEMPAVELSAARLDADPHASEDARRVFQYIRKNCQPTPSSVLTYVALTEVVGGGPKVFLPTATECASMQHVALNVPRADYRQPFPALVVALPTEFGRTLPCRLYDGVEECPGLLTVCHHAEAGWLTLLVIFGGGSSYSCEIDLRGDPAVSLEEILAGRLRHENHLVPDPVMTALWRVAFNSCLLMTHYRPADQGYVEGERVAYLQARIAKARKVDPVVRQQNRTEVATAARVYGFDQHIRVYKTEERGECREGTGEPVHPHWRSGHWAMQPHGPGGTLRKRIFRRPVFVNAHLFAGTPADTTVTATTG